MSLTQYSWLYPTHPLQQYSYSTIAEQSCITDSPCSPPARQNCHKYRKALAIKQSLTFHHTLVASFTSSRVMLVLSPRKLLSSVRNSMQWHSCTSGSKSCGVHTQIEMCSNPGDQDTSIQYIRQAICCRSLVIVHKDSTGGMKCERCTLRSLMGTQGQFQKPCWASICLSS